jgi:hypothetical protein
MSDKSERLWRLKIQVLLYVTPSSVEQQIVTNISEEHCTIPRKGLH